MTEPTTVTEIDPSVVLSLPMRNNDANATTVRGYLVELLAAVWRDGDGFSGKRPFGNDSWEYELYDALGHGGLIDVGFGPLGCINRFPDSERRKADSIIGAAINHLGATTMTESTTVTDEIAAMARLVKILEGLDPRTRERVFRYLVERYQPDEDADR